MGQKNFYKLLTKPEGQLTEAELKDSYDQAMNVLDGAAISQNRESNKAKKELKRLYEVFAKDPTEECVRAIVGLERDIKRYEEQKAGILRLRDYMDKEEE